MEMMKKRGFTLIELLTVLAILSVLGAILLPALRAARESAQVSQSSSNLRQLVLANTTYEVEHGHYAPATTQSNDVRWHGERVAGNVFAAPGGFLTPYLSGGEGIRRCPLLDNWTLVDADSFEDGSGGYGYNSVYVGGRPGNPLRPARAADIARPSSTVMFATTALARQNGLQEYPFAEPPFWDFGNGPTTFRPDASVHFRARGRALVGWVDGRVSAEEPTRFGSSSVYGGTPEGERLGWFGPEENNGFWNPVH